ncbi:hypothetical protein J8F10_17970 [Gemmata sp. G18]|uniref:Uncharacterized protein n=1 Tax=Gemmata palustris TaxID=2822762 RepID=A0ABS5BV28_9BACT|nr:hypothetical protein [Gemmata palustris]MBP3957155.1 hypothetical protein [Gemmata palustris]
MTVFVAEYQVRPPGSPRERWAEEAARAHVHFFDEASGLLLVRAPDDFQDRGGRFHPLTEPEFERLSQIARYWLEQVE